jgi:hypothetical protein
MKATQNTRSNYAIELILLCMLAGFMPSCTPSDKPSSEQQEAEEMPTGEPQPEGEITILSGPVTMSQVAQGAKEFEDLYVNATPNLHNDDVKVELDDWMNDLLTKFPNSPDTGYVFHYGMNEKDNELHPCYIMSTGSRDTSDPMTTCFRPFPGNEFHPNPHYLLLAGDASSPAYRAIDQTAFDALTNRYKSNMKRLESGTARKVTDYPNHPFYVFHQGSEFALFHATCAPSDPEVMTIRHCAGQLPATDAEYQVPVFILEGEQTTQTKYTGKAFDVGNLCPPHCRRVPFDPNDPFLPCYDE